MTIRRPSGRPPSSTGGGRRVLGERLSQRAEMRVGLVSPTDRILTSWSAAARFAAVAIVVLGAVMLTFWLIPLDLTVGPLHVRPACQESKATDSSRGRHHQSLNAC